MDEGRNQMPELVLRLRSYWQSIGADPNPGVPPGEIEAFEAARGLLLPDEFRSYLSVVDGTRTCDEQMFEWFPLHRIESIPDELAQFGGSPDYRGIIEALPDVAEWHVFIDYLIASHVYAARLTPTRCSTTPVLWVCGSEHRQIANSLAEFLETYLANPEAVLFPPDL